MNAGIYFPHLQLSHFLMTRPSLLIPLLPQVIEKTAHGGSGGQV